MPTRERKRFEGLGNKKRNIGAFIEGGDLPPVIGYCVVIGILQARKYPESTYGEIMRIYSSLDWALKKAEEKENYLLNDLKDKYNNLLPLVDQRKRSKENRLCELLFDCIRDRGQNPDELMNSIGYTLRGTIPSKCTRKKILQKDKDDLTNCLKRIRGKK